MTNSPAGSERAIRTLGYLRDRITSGDWPVGSKIPTEADLIGQLGVGRTTVREAIRSLASLGMLEPLAGRGTFVRSRNPVSSVIAEFVSGFDVAEVLRYRRALEVEAAQLAAVNRTDQQLAALRQAHANDEAEPEVTISGIPTRTPGNFHSIIMEASHSKLIASLYTGVMAELRRAVRSGLIENKSPDSERRADHLKLIDAIASGDPAAAAHAMADHVDNDLHINTDDPRNESLAADDQRTNGATDIPAST